MKPKTVTQQASPQPSGFLDLLCEYGVAVILIAIWAETRGVLIDSFVPAAVAAMAAVGLCLARLAWVNRAWTNLCAKKLHALTYYAGLATSSAASAIGAIAVWSHFFG